MTNPDPAPVATQPATPDAPENHVSLLADSDYHTDEERDLDTARDWLRRGNRAEAMIHIERALGSEFIGTLT